MIVMPVLRMMRRIRCSIVSMISFLCTAVNRAYRSRRHGDRHGSKDHQGNQKDYNCFLHRRPPCN
jgi:hypothetical protein